MLNGQYFVECSPCSWKMSQKHFFCTKQTSCRLISCRQLSFQCSVFEHCFVGCYRCSAQLHLFGRLLGSFVNSLSLSGIRSWHDFLLHTLHTKMLHRFSCYTGNISLCVLHVLGRCHISTLSEQIERPVSWCLVDNYLLFLWPLRILCTRHPDSKGSSLLMIYAWFWAILLV